MSEKTQATFLSDLPSADDHLDFQPYRETLRDIIADPRTLTPLTVGIFGSWGAGKTTLLKMLQRDLNKAQRDKPPKHCTVWFNAWKYAKEDSLWRALLLRVVEAVQSRIRDGDTDTEAQDDLAHIQQALYHTIEREELGRLEFDPSKLGKAAIDIGLQALQIAVPGLGLTASILEKLTEKVTGEGPGKLLQAFERERTKLKMDQLKSIEQFEDHFARLIKVYIKTGRLVVFVDDLDRCLPEKALDVLEAIKLFFDVPGCVFVVAVDRAVIARGIKIKYEKLGDTFDGNQYLEKIIQLPFDLPQLEKEDVRQFVRQLAPRLGDERCAEAFAVGLAEANPRRIKRSINVFLLLSRLAEARLARLGPINPVRLAKLVVIQQGYPDLYEVLKAYPIRLHEVDALFQSRRQRKDTLAGDGVKIPDHLVAFANQPGLERLLAIGEQDTDACFSAATLADIQPYFTLVRSVVEEPKTLRPGLFVPQTVPVPASPFWRGTSQEDIDWLVKNTDWAKEWNKQGNFNVEKPKKQLTIPAFEIGKYPITNREYQSFIEATDHAPPQHWAGKTAPEELLNHPVVYVSFRDALAYCEWLSRQTRRNYRLPIETEWEKAARGSDGRFYPWGNDFDPQKCNATEGGPGGTTPVGQYSVAGGDSPYGCSDMAGNVWEWCSTHWEDHYESPSYGNDGLEGDNPRVVRGGSWNHFQRVARCAFRGGNYPNSQLNGLGFRVVLGPPT